jgi:uncharacterized protein (DUF58 family)
VTTWRGGTCVRAHWSLRVTAAGWLVLLLGLSVGWVAVRTSNPWLLLTACAVVAPLAVSILPTFGELHVHATAELPRRCHVGDDVEHAITFYNAGRRSLPAMRLHQSVPGFEDVVIGVQAYGPRRRGDAHVSRHAVGRAVAPPATYRLETTAPFGLTVRRHTFGQATEATVHPRPVPPVSLASLGVGDQPVNRPARAGLEPHGLREWQRGDELRHVHWRATARHGQLVVVVPELTHSPRLAIVVAGVPGDPDWEALVSLAAWTAVDAVRRGHTLRLAAGGATDLVGPDAMHALDWFAGLGDVTAAPPALLDAAADWVGDLGVVLVATTRPAGAGTAGAGTAGGGPEAAGRVRLLRPGGVAA